MIAIINIISKLRTDKFIMLWQYSGKQDIHSPVLTEFTM